MSRNIFLFGRQPGMEDQLTEMLVWLISAVPEVGGAIVRLAFGDMSLDLSELEVTTQYRIAGGRLDALLKSKSMLLVVESKLGSVYGASQLRAYIDWIATEHKDVPHRALMTLTAYEGPWLVDDLTRAAQFDVVASPRRWHELYSALRRLMAALDELPARLVQEFLEMLSEEGLGAVEPLRGDELTDAWSRSRAVVERYHAYFRVCVEAIAEALQASPQGSVHAGHASVWVNFLTAEGENITVALEDSDRAYGISSKVHRDGPIIWCAAAAPEWPDWESVVVKLESTPLEGWRSASRWYGWPRTWRYLDEVVKTGTFGEQRSELAAACTEVRDWLRSGKSPSPADPGRTSPGQATAGEADPD